MQPLDINMADEDLNMDTDAIALEDIEENSVENETSTAALNSYVMAKYKKSDDYRYEDEQRWVRAYRNYRGLYGPDVQFTEAEKSRVFIKVTKTKTLAAYGQIVDVLFANNKFPLSVDPTELPEGVAKDVNFDPKEPQELMGSNSMESPYGFKGDGKDLPKGATAKSLEDMLGPLADNLSDIEQQVSNYIAEKRGAALAKVISAVELNDSTQNDLKAALKSKLGRDIELSLKVDSSVIGGIKVSIGERTFDGLLSSKFSDIQTVLEGR